MCYYSKHYSNHKLIAFSNKEHQFFCSISLGFRLYSNWFEICLMINYYWVEEIFVSQTTSFRFLACNMCNINYSGNKISNFQNQVSWQFIIPRCVTVKVSYMLKQIDTNWVIVMSLEASMFTVVNVDLFG